MIGTITINPSIDQHMAIDAQLLADQRRADDPRIVGEADDFAARRPGNRNRDRARQTALTLGEVLPRGLKARMILGVQSGCFAERQHAPARNLGHRKTRVGAADVDRDDSFAHISPSPVGCGLLDRGNVAWPKAMQQRIAMRCAMVRFSDLGKWCTRHESDGHSYHWEIFVARDPFSATNARVVPSPDL